MSITTDRRSSYLTKQAIRSKILLKLKIQKEDTRNRKSRIIERKLLRTRVFKKAKNVMFYVAFGGEVETEGMIKAARKSGKIVTVPIVGNNRTGLRPCLLVKGARLRRGPYGVREPVRECLIDPKIIDLVITPGLAFDRKGRRLGRGKGCYDRFLRQLPKDTPTIGLAFDFQILPSLPTNAHDVSVHRVIYG